MAILYAMKICRIILQSMNYTKMFHNTCNALTFIQYSCCRGFMKISEDYKNLIAARDEPILLFSHLFFFPAILLFSTYFSEYFA